MIYEVKRKLTLNERKHIKDYKEGKTEVGFVLTDIVHNEKYNAMLIVPHKYEEEMTSSINILDLETDKEYTFTVLDNVLGNYKLRVNDDIIDLTIL